MALAKKRDLLYQLRPDIAVVPECSRASMSVCREDGFDTRWWGKNHHKGLGVLAAKPYSLEDGKDADAALESGSVPQRPRRQRPPTQKWIAPVQVRGPHDFLLLSVWACPVGTKREQNYVGQTYDAIIRHPKWFAESLPTVICGDFNSSPVYDPGRKKKTHSNVVQLLTHRGLASAYHEFFCEPHGAETRPTYYFWHRQERCFHIDYIFLPRAWMKSVVDVAVGAYAQWRAASDHMPVVVDIVDRA